MTPTERYRIEGMDCGSCALTIEKAMRQLPGVSDVAVSFTTEMMDVSGAAAREDIERRLRELGYRLAGEKALGSEVTELELPARRGLAGFMSWLWGQARLRYAAVATVVLLVATVALIERQPRVLDVLFMATVVLIGAPIFVKGFRALLFARRVTIDLLMAIAAVGALLIGAGGEAVTVILLYTLGEALEAYSAERARDSLRSLLALQPQRATVLRAHEGDDGHEHGGHEHAAHGHEHEHEHDHGHDHAAHDHAGHDHAAHDHGHDHGHAHAHDDHGHDHGHDHAQCAGDHDDHDHGSHDHGAAGGHDHEPHDHAVVLPVEQVALDDRVLVRPGERIPVDGVVLKGLSSVDQAAVTGESIPVTRGEGDAVMAGTINGEGALEIRVTEIARDSTIARIARLVEDAQARRSPAERFIDRFARWYTPAVVLLAVLMVIVPVYGFGQPLLDLPDGTHGWLYRALTLLIIACPCALVISIPVTVVSALTRLAQLGILVKGGAQLDVLADTRAVAFDKTGTLTAGRPAVTAMRTSDCLHDDDHTRDCLACDELVAVAASVESSSEHPVAHAIVSEAGERRGARPTARAQSVTAHAGKGISGVLANGQRIAVGTDSLFEAASEGYAALATLAHRVRDAGNTLMYVARDDRIIGYIGVQDRIRETTRAALSALRDSGPGVSVVMLTGDNPQVAARVAAEIGGIDAIEAGLLPEGKLTAIERLRERYGTVAMVGDGINDAPALARADVGIAMGRGTAQAMETADVVLMQDDIAHVPVALRIARKSRRLVKQNIALALGLKLAFLALAVPGITTLWLAVLADVGATLIVTLNGMRLLRET